MKRNLKRAAKAIALVLAGAMLLGGCGQKQNGDDGSKASSTASKASSEAKTSEEVSEEKDWFTGYPVQSDTTLTYFMATNTNLTSFAENFGDTEIAKALQEKTGVKIEYVHPAAGQEKETLALHAASNALEDLVEFNWYGYTGGPEQAIKEKLIIPLNDYLDSGKMPNLKAYLEEHPEIDKMIKTDSGLYYAVPFIRGAQKLLVSTGPIIRKDWMEELNLELPKTLEDMENILVQFKEKKGATAPMSAGYLAQIIALAGGYRWLYTENGTTVNHGVLNESYRKAVETLHDWYEKGLLDNDFVSIDSKTLDSNILNDKTGVTYAAGGSGLGKWLESMESSDSGFDLEGFSLPYAFMLGNIDSPYFGGGSVAISANCKDPELAARFLDYGYSEEGHMLYNFGIEGVSYTMVDGSPVYTDEIKKNPDGLTMAQAMLKYFRASNVGPFVQDERYIEQYYGRPQQQAALEAWLGNYDTESKMVYPKATMSAEENSEYSSIMSEVDAQINEKTTQFIIGTLSMDEFDNFIEDLKKLKIERAIELKQAALDRYNAR